MNTKKKSIHLNKLVLSAIFLCILAIIAKLSLVTLSNEIDGIDLKEFAANRNTVNETLYADRGTIYDVNGDILAESVNSYTIIAYLSANRTDDINNPQHVVDINRTASLLAPILNISEEYIRERLNQKLYQVEFGAQGSGITELVKEEIEALNLPGIDFIEGSKRFYSMGSFASYTLGYARTNDEGKIVGEMGIESYFNKTLTGTDGQKVYQKDAYGFQIPNTELEMQEAMSGNDIYLTLDSNIQLFTENAISKITKDHELDWTTITIVDAQTGAILSTASSPTFNPNTLEIESYLNPLTGYTYEPGSTMKIFSYMAAMEEGIYDGDALYESGTITVADSVIKDFNGVGWGEISFDDGFTYSSNVATSTLALELGVDKLDEHYDNLGFGQKTGISLPGEAAGKVDFKYQTELATASYGHGITSTPLQMIQALTFLANDGNVMQPYIIDKIVNPNTNEVIEETSPNIVANVASSETTAKLIELMDEAVTSKRTNAYRYVPESVSVLGKTGTSIMAENGVYLTGEYDYIQSFAGVFPAEEPRYIIYVATQRFQGSINVVGSAVASLIAETAKYLNVEKEDIAKAEVLVELDSFIGKNIEIITKEIEELKLIPVIIGNGEKVLKQYPLDTKILVGNKVFLYTNNIEIIAPNFSNWTRNEVSRYCELLDIECTFSGYGNVTESNIKEGDIININTPLAFILK